MARILSAIMIASAFAIGFLTGSSGDSKKITDINPRSVLSAQCVDKQDVLKAIEHYLPDLKDQPVTGRFGLDTLSFQEKKRISAADMREVLRIIINRC